MTNRCTTLHTDTWRGIHITKYAYDIPHTSHHVHIICTDTSHTKHIYSTHIHTSFRDTLYRDRKTHTSNTCRSHQFHHTTHMQYMTHATRRDTYVHYSTYQLSNMLFVHTHIQLQIYHTPTPPPTHIYHTQHMTHMHVPCKSRVLSQSQPVMALGQKIL